MKKLSDTTWTLINSLHARPSLLQRVTGSSVRRTQVLREIGRSGEPAAVPFLIRYLFSSPGEESSAAAEAIHSLLQVTPSEDLPWLDEQIRSWGYEPGSEWSRLRPEEVRKASFPAECELSILGLISFHPNGYVRQEAIRRLSETANPESLRFLLVRLNDWVPNVRDAALRTVEMWLAEGYFDAFLPNLCLVSRLAECQRDDYTNLINAVAQTLVRPEHVEVMFRLIEQGHRTAARQWFRTVLALPEADQRQFIQAGLKSKDVVIRLRAARAAPTFFQDDLASVLTGMRRDPFAALRIEALSIYVVHLPESAKGVLHESLLDRSASVREHARYHLRKTGIHDFAAVYRESIRDGVKLPTALEGLGETGSESDVALILPYLQSPITVRRRAAVQALSGLAGDLFIDTFLDCLQDDSPRVARTAGKWLSKRTHLLDLERIATLALADKPDHVRHTALALFGSVDIWKALPHLIRASGDDDESIRIHGQSLIEKRFNRVFTKPNDEQAAHIRQAIREVEINLDRRFVPGLAHWLSALRIHMI